MSGTGLRLFLGLLIALALLSGWSVLRSPEPIALEAAREAPNLPVAMIPEVALPSSGPLEALPREEGYAQEGIGAPEGALTDLPPNMMSGGASAQGLTAALRPAPKPLTLQPLAAVSRILVEKSQRRLTVYVGDQVARVWPIALGRDPTGDKLREGDNRTPEGIFRVDRLNAASAYHLSLGLDYPQPKHRAAARALGASPGGDIMIHGQPNRSPFGKLPGDWTAGCIALTDAEVTQLFAATAIGTVVEIRP